MKLIDPSYETIEQEGYTPEHPQSDEYEYEQELWEN